MPAGVRSQMLVWRLVPYQGRRLRVRDRWYLPGLFPAIRGDRRDQARPGTDSAIFRLGLQGSTRQAVPAGQRPGAKSVDKTTRKPLFLFWLFGLFLLRAAQRTFLSLLLNEPPRNTRHL